MSGTFECLPIRRAAMKSYAILFKDSTPATPETIKSNDGPVRRSNSSSSVKRSQYPKTLKTELSKVIGTHIQVKQENDVIDEAKKEETAATTQIDCIVEDNVVVEKKKRISMEKKVDRNIVKKRREKNVKKDVNGNVCNVNNEEDKDYATDTDSSDHDSIGVYEGLVTDEHIALEKLWPPIGKYFLRKYKVIAIDSLDANTGVTFTAIIGNLEVVIRSTFLQSKSLSVIQNEMRLLENADIGHCAHLFGTLLDVGFINSSRPDGIVYYSKLYRGGPSLIDCIGFCNGRLTNNSTIRIVFQIVQIMEQANELGFCMRVLSPKMFSIDRRSRRIYPHDITHIIACRKSSLWTRGMNEKIEDAIVTPNGTLTWNGPIEYAPIAWHEKGEEHVMNDLDAMESLIYIAIEMMYGFLPWTPTHDDMLKEKKAHMCLYQKDNMIYSVGGVLLSLWERVIQWKMENRKMDYAIVIQLILSDCPEEDELYDWEMEEVGSVAERLVLAREEAVINQMKIDIMEKLTNYPKMKTETVDDDETMQTSEYY